MSKVFVIGRAVIGGVNFSHKNFYRFRFHIFLITFNSAFTLLFLLYFRYPKKATSASSGFQPPLPFSGEEEKEEEEKKKKEEEREEKSG